VLVEIDDDEDLRRFDRKRKNKKVSNKDWTSPTDPDMRKVFGIGTPRSIAPLAEIMAVEG